MQIKQKSPSYPRNLALGTFGKLPIVFSTKVNLLYLFYSTAQRCCLLTTDKVELFTENFSKNSYLDDPVMSLPVLPSRTTLKLNNISVAPKMLKKVKTNLDLSEASGPDCIQWCF